MHIWGKLPILSHFAPNLCNCYLKLSDLMNILDNQLWGCHSTQSPWFQCLSVVCPPMSEVGELTNPNLSTMMSSCPTAKCWGVDMNTTTHVQHKHKHTHATWTQAHTHGSGGWSPSYRDMLPIMQVFLGIP